MSIDNLINLIQKLQGIGPRSAKRIVLNLIKNKRNFMFELAQAIINVADEIKTCQLCNNIDTQNPCQICHNPTRDHSMLCIVEDIADLWALEKTNKFQGLYYVLGGSLSSEFDTNELNIQKLIDIHFYNKQKIKEIIIATNGTIDGQTTAFYITEKLKKFPIKITRLAFGLPIGAELDYLDEATLETALKLRNNFND